MYSMLILTYHNPEYLKLCVNSILENSYYNTHQFVIHVNGYDKETMDYLEDKNIKYILTQEIGAPDALNLCIDNIECKNTLLVNDDSYFAKNWDYYLHQWEIELNEKFPDYIKIIGYRWCEPKFGSFPPICDAGKTVKEFDINKLNEYISKNSTHDVYGWQFNSLYPTDILTKFKFSSEFFPGSLSDIDFTMKFLKYFKDNNIKFLIFSVKDCCAYHFQGVTMSRMKIPHIDNASLFKNKWNMDIEAAWSLIHDEERRSISLIKGLPIIIDEPEKQEIKNFVTQGYIDILRRSPDPDGLAHYVESIYNKTISKDRFLDVLRNSEEYIKGH